MPQPQPIMLLTGASRGIGHATVKNHVHHILTKLHARGRGELAARIRREEERAAALGRLPRRGFS